MESLFDPVEPEKPVEPTAGDVENARVRAAIAARQQAEYDHCLQLALEALGEGWNPWMKLCLIESDYHRHPDTPVVGATVFKVYRGEERLTENSVFLMEKDGKVLQASSYEALLGDLLREKHPTYGFDRQGEWVAYDRWSLCWSAFERYEPKSAEQLAALRISRERKKVEREEKRWRDEHPLFVGLEGREDPGEKLPPG